MKINAVIFDLDDTLYDQQKPFADAIDTLFPAISNNISINELYKKSRFYSDALWDDYCEKKRSLEEVRALRISLALKDYGLEISEKDALAFQAHYEAAQSSIVLFEDANEVFNKLTKNGVKIGLLTNGPVEHQFRKIQQLGLTNEIPRELIFISDELGIAKPDPEIFHMVSRAFGIESKNLLYVGDTWRNDIAGACEAGWYSAWFNHRGRKPASSHQPTLVFEKNLSELLPFLNMI